MKLVFFKRIIVFGAIASFISSYAAEIKAKKMEIIQEKGERVTRFKEGLLIQDGTTQIFAQEGLYYPERNEFFLKDSVKILSEEGVLRSDSAVYFLALKKSILGKNVELDLDTVKITTDRLFWDGNKKEAHSEEVFISLKGRGVEITGKSAIYQVDKKKGEIKKDPLFYLKEKETTLVRANLMDYDGERKVVFAYGQVNIKHRKRELFCETLAYFLEGDSGITLGKPILSGENEEIAGKEFRFQNEGGELKKMVVLGDVQALFERKEERVEIGGERLSSLFRGGEVLEIVMEELTYGRLLRKRR